MLPHVDTWYKDLQKWLEDIHRKRLTGFSKCFMLSEKTNLVSALNLDVNGNCRRTRIELSSLRRKAAVKVVWPRNKTLGYICRTSLNCPLGVGGEGNKLYSLFLPIERFYRVPLKYCLHHPQSWKGLREKRKHSRFALGDKLRASPKYPKSNKTLWIQPWALLIHLSILISQLSVLLSGSFEVLPMVFDPDGIIRTPGPLQRNIAAALETQLLSQWLNC